MNLRKIIDTIDSLSLNKKSQEDGLGLNKKWGGVPERSRPIAGLKFLSSFIRVGRSFFQYAAEYKPDVRIMDHAGGKQYDGLV